MLNRRGRLIGVGLLAAGSLLIAACGDESEDAVDDATSEVSAAAEDAGVDTEEVAEQAEDLAEEATDEAADGVDTEEAEEQSTALAETLRENGLGTLASAVEQVDIEEMVGGEEFTFFAPNDEAFLALTADDTADLLADPTKLADILRNHVVDERIDSAALVEMTSLTTVGGEALVVEADGETVTLNGVQVVSTDIDAADGVIHVIEEVLLP